MIGTKKRARIAHIDGYMADIEDYKKLIIDNEKRIADIGASTKAKKKTKEGYRAINEICKSRIKHAQKEIRRLLNE